MLGQRSTIRNLCDYGQHISVLDKSGIDIIQSRVYRMKFEDVKTVNPQKFVESKCFFVGFGNCHYQSVLYSKPFSLQLGRPSW